jgi:hypothetical protein
VNICESATNLAMVYRYMKESEMVQTKKDQRAEVPLPDTRG